MQITKIAASTRNEMGKGANRRLRAQGQLPAVTYGAGAASQALVVSPDEVANVLTSDLGINSLVELSIDGRPVRAMIGDYQYHPLTRKLLHADFVQVTDEQEVEVKVPVRLTGKAQGVVMGGKLRVVFRELPVRCRPALIPSEIVHDITELGIEQTLSAGELQLPEGVKVVLDQKRTIAIVATDRRAKAAESEDEEKEGDK